MQSIVKWMGASPGNPRPSSERLTGTRAAVIAQLVGRIAPCRRRFASLVAQTIASAGGLPSLCPPPLPPIICRGQSLSCLRYPCTAKVSITFQMGLLWAPRAVLIGRRSRLINVLHHVITMMQLLGLMAAL